MKRLFMLLGVLGFVASVLAPSARAGGWAVVTLDALPDEVMVAQPPTVAFTIRQHGVTPWECDCAQVRGYHPSGERIQVPAKMDKAGHYTASLVFNKPGVWHWDISSGLYPDWQPMPDLGVIDPAEVEGAFAKAQADKSLAQNSGLDANSLAVLEYILRVIGLARTDGKTLNLLPDSQASGTPAAEPAAFGAKLFVAKGCVVCHRHESLASLRRTIDFYLDEAPDLSRVSADAEYLHRWLRDPKAVKPATYMPNLNLAASEIDALVAFLKAGR